MLLSFFFFQAEDGIRDYKVTGVQTCALPTSPRVSLPCARMDPNAGKDMGNTVDHEVSEWLDRIGAATDRLLAAADLLTDPGVREPSLLPGWTRGHVLSHPARNADGLGNLL